MTFLKDFCKFAFKSWRNFTRSQNQPSIIDLHLLETMCNCFVYGHTPFEIDWSVTSLSWSSSTMAAPHNAAHCCWVLTLFILLIEVGLPHARLSSLVAVKIVLNMCRFSQSIIIIILGAGSIFAVRLLLCWLQYNGVQLPMPHHPADPTVSAQYRLQHLLGDHHQHDRLNEGLQSNIYPMMKLSVGRIGWKPMLHWIRGELSDILRNEHCACIR